MVWNRPFYGAINEDPYERLQEFDELHSDLVVLGITQEALRWKLFPLPLTRGRSNGTLEW